MTFNQFLAQLPNTNYKIFFSGILAILYVLALLAGLLFQIPMSSETLQILGGFILLMMGIDVTQFGIKRLTDSTYVAAKAGDAPPPVVPVVDPVVPAPVVPPVAPVVPQTFIPPVD